MSGGVVVPLKARELADEEQKAHLDLCTAIEDRVRMSLARGRVAMWEMAEALYEFDQENGWTALGFATKTQWLAQPWLELEERTYRRMVRAWGGLVVMRGVDRSTLTGLDRSKVDIVMATIEGGELGQVTLEEVLEDVRTLTARALCRKYDSATGLLRVTEPKAPAPARAPSPNNKPLTITRAKTAPEQKSRPTFNPNDGKRGSMGWLSGMRVEDLPTAKAEQAAKDALTAAEMFERSACALGHRTVVRLASEVIERWQKAADTAWKADRGDAS